MTSIGRSAAARLAQPGDDDDRRQRRADRPRRSSATASAGSAAGTRSRGCPATNAASMPDQQRPELTATPASPVTSLRTSKMAAPSVIGVAIRNENRAAASRSETGEAAGRDRDARSADARDQRQRLGGADRRPPIGNVTSSTPLVRPPHRSASHRIDRADDQRHRDESPVSRKVVLDEVVEQEAGERRRDGRRDQQPGQPPVGVVPERPVADRREARPAPGGPSRPGSRRAAPAASRCGASR